MMLIKREAKGERERKGERVLLSSSWVTECVARILEWLFVRHQAFGAEPYFDRTKIVLITVLLRPIW